MRSIGFYLSCDEAIHNKVKDYMDNAYTKCVKNFEEIPPLMCSVGFYSRCDDAILKKVQEYIDKTYNNAFKYFLELMKRDLESEEYTRE